ncbi:PAS domain S-box protein [Bernardetia sp.]|uniref:PAS domain S-box protein n=1 Tax=Bernardetia sp. TaxID=1937974 RepID=UPI0025BDEB9C|nr:PAS domain S-box protein [Bernardetia sp.]
MKQHISVENFVPDEELLEAYEEETFHYIDTIMERFLIVYLAFSLVLAVFYQEFVQVYLFLPSLGAFFAYHLIKRFVMPQDARYVLTAVLAMMGVVYLIQLQGAFYIQFVFFITLTVLVFYQNWRILVFYASLIGAYILICFALYSVFGQANIKEYFLNVENLDSQVAFFGCLLGAAELFVAIFFAGYLKKQTDQDARNKIYLNEQLNFSGNLAFANKIAEGELDSEFVPAENDVMGEALLNMRNSLKSFVENERLNKWRSDGVAQISDILVSSESITMLSQQVLNKVVSYLGAHQGIFYSLHKDSFKHEPYLKATAAYAYDDIEKLDQKILIGDGLVGQVAESKDPIYLKNPPPHFFKIKSAIGEAPPQGLMLLPLQLRENLVGVLEIALLRPLSQHERSFLEEISSRIAATMIALRSQEDNKRLLEESQEYAEQIASQEEEMRQNVEELTSTQEELAKQMRETEYIKNEVTAQLEALNLSALLIQLDTQGRIISSNERVSDAIRRYEDDLDGIKLAQLIDDKEHLQSWERVWAQVQLGEIGHLVFKNKRPDKSSAWIDLTIAPVRDKNEQIYKYIAIGLNITRQMKQDARLKRLLKETEEAREKATTVSRQNQEQLRAIDNSVAMLEMDSEGQILQVNENFLKIMGYEKKEDLEGKYHSDLVEKGTVLTEEYLDLWKKLRQGETVEGTFKRMYSTGKTVWVRGSYTPTLNSKNELAKVTKLSYDVTESKKQQIELENLLEQMTAQEEEMRISMEYLQNTQEELDRKTKEFKDFHNFINDFNVIIDFDEKGTILSVNELCEKITGYDESEVIGHSYSDFEELEGNETFEHLWKETIEGDYTERIVKVKAADGSIIFLKTFYIPIHDQNNEVTKITAVSDDITTQKQQEKLIQKNIDELEKNQVELEQREKFLESLLSILDEIPALVGRATLGKKLDIVYVNEFGEELIGYDANFIKKNGFGGFIHKEDIPKLAQVTKEKLAKSDSYSASFRVVTKDKKIKTVWEYAQKVDFNGKECIDFFIIDPSIISQNDL